MSTEEAGLAAPASKASVTRSLARSSAVSRDGVKLSTRTDRDQSMENVVRSVQEKPEAR